MGSVRRTIRLEGPDADCEGLDADPAYQWETKHKMFSLAEVCAPIAILVTILYSSCI